MAKIEPFRALVYNRGEIRDLSRVVCPPYDIISPSQQEYYHQLHPHNFIHILLGKDTSGEDKYRRAAHLFKDWQKDKILVWDKSPAIYFYSQQYNFKGEKRARLGFIARLYLEDKGGAIYGHEHTRLEPKEDRLKLLKNVKANLSPIFVIFADKKRIIQSARQYLKDMSPFIDIVDEEKITHKLWRLDDQSLLNKLQAGMQNENIFIADGHHRYEVACAYRDEMLKKLGAKSAQAGFNYLLAYFTDTNSSGLTVLPIHRLAKLNLGFSLDNFRSKISDYFDIEEAGDKMRLFFLMQKAGKAEHVLGMYYHRQYWLMRLKNIKILDRFIDDRPPEFRTLDVSILNYIVLKNTLGLDLEDKEAVTFSPHAEELIDKVDNDPAQIAFFLNPVKVQQIMSVASGGQKMPAKSTYFYPKVLSGLVINKHEG